MPPKNSDDQGENPDKLNFSKTQLTVIVGSIAAIVVLALALGFLTKKNQAKLDEQATVEAPPAEQATEMPLPEGAKKEELSKLEETLPKQVPQTPDEELKAKAEKKTEAASTAPAATEKGVAAPTPAPGTITEKTPSKPVAAAPAPSAPQKSVAAPAPASGTITEKTPSKPVAAAPVAAASQKGAATPALVPAATIEKTSPKAAPAVTEKSAKPKKEKKAKHEKPKKKRVYPRSRKALKPLQKKVDIKKINVAPKAEPRKEPKKIIQTPVNDGKAGKLENKPTASSFSSEIKPDTLPPAPATVEAPVAPAPVTAKATEPKAVEPKAAEQKAVEPKAAEPKYTLLAETVASEADAKSRVAALKKSGYQAYYLKTVTTKNTWYRVMLGAYPAKEEADAAAAEFAQKEHSTAKILPYEKP